MELKHFSGKVAQKVIIEWQGKVLLSRNSFDKNRGVWDLPGGRLNIGEDPMAGAAREIKEELGFDVEITGIALVSTFMHWRIGEECLLVVYIARPPAEPVIVLDPKEVEEIVWVSKDDLLSYPLFESYQRALNVYFGVK